MLERKKETETETDRERERGGEGGRRRREAETMFSPLALSAICLSHARYAIRMKIRRRIRVGFVGKCLSPVKGR